MAKKTPMDKLGKAIEQALADYAGSVTRDVNGLARTFAKKGAKAVRENAASMFGSGRYSKGWSDQFTENRYSAQGVIFNKDVPGLPHLLENGHAKRGGGRTRAFVHIAPVEEKITEEFQRAVEEAI